MRLLLVSHYFPPEIGAPQARLSGLARHWAGAGDEVCVLTGMPNHPTGVVPPRYRHRLRVIERRDGCRVVRTWLYATPNEGVLRKTIGHLSFMVSSVLLGWRVTGPADVVVVSSPTFFSIFAAWLLARIKRAAFVVEVRDLWPAIFVELGVLTNPTLIRLLERAELAAYRAATAVVVVSEGFRQDLVRRGIPPSKVHVIRNGVDLAEFRPRDPTDPDSGTTGIRSRWGAEPGDVIVLYAGAHGLSHGLTTLAEAAALLRDAPLRFVCVGEGAAKRELRARVDELRLDSFLLAPGVPHEQVPDLLAAADICVVPLRDVPLFASFIPSKIFEYLAAGKAVVGAVRGEAREILCAAGAVVVDPDDPAALARALRYLASDPRRRAAMGRQARAYVEEHFDRRQLAQRYHDILLSLAHPAVGSPPAG
ncbi:glycosyltransferase family 4 protein [Rhabdothermincola sediminis]|uniref:glycosyltransferase family 4 protein n=1 Tax=Rhabdothermincola sediminis TaxID=2751370 RepID=UPI001AA02917|nr:glycosyltransferase family 4 protein [Rhabdothermincola sediminis]